MKKIVLETERLILREYVQEDFDALKAIISDAETMKFYPKPYDDKGVQRWLDWNFDNYANLGFGLWAIELKSTGEFIGDCGITMQIINKKIVSEIGYHINKNHWNRGYATEAARACKKWAFENTSFRRLYSYMNAENTASARVAEHNGMLFVEEYTDGEDILKVYMAEKGDTIIMPM